MSATAGLTIKEMVSPLRPDHPFTTPEDAMIALQAFVKNLEGADRLVVELAKGEAQKALQALGFSAPGTLVKAAVAAARSNGSLAGQALVAPDPEPWAEPVDGAALLTAMRDVFLRYSVLVPHAAETLALNALRTHVMEAFDFNPTLAVPSPTKRCGKTTLLGVNAALVARPLLVSQIQPAGIYRAIEEVHPTLLLDEADTYESMKERYKGILNSGHHRPSAWVEVQVSTPSGAWIPRKFSTYAPLFLGFIGTIPDTLWDRAIVIPMRRKKKTERVEDFNQGQRAALLPLKRQAIRWALDNQAALRLLKPAVPEGLNDRQEDCWRPLLAIAEQAGGEWPVIAQAAAVALSEEQHEEPTVDMYLLEALRELFKQATKLPSAVILRRLNGDGEAPWSRWNNGMGLNSHDLGKHLRAYGARSKTLYWKGSEWPVGEAWGDYPAGGKAKGYERSGLEDGWERYLSVVPVAPVDADEAKEPPVDAESWAKLVAGSQSDQPAP